MNPLVANAAPAAASETTPVASAAPAVVDHGLPPRLHAQMQARARELFAQIDAARQNSSAVALLD
jgi:hypothetical protein